MNQTENIEVPNLAEIDMFLPMHTASLEGLFGAKSAESTFGDIRATKSFKTYDTEDGPIELPIIQGFGSSEIEDTDGDTFTENALKSLCTAREGLGVWKNHKFELFGDYMGKLAEPPEFMYGNSADWPTGAIPHHADKWAGVWIKAAIETANPPAADLYKFVKRGHQFGFSVGCMYTKYQKKIDRRGAAKGFKVDNTRPVEWSVVGVPANQASWVDTTRKMLVAKGHMGATDDLHHLEGETLHRFSHWDELPEKDAVLVRKFMEGLEKRTGLVLAIPVSFEAGAPKRRIY